MRRQKDRKIFAQTRADDLSISEWFGIHENLTNSISGVYIQSCRHVIVVRPSRSQLPEWLGIHFVDLWPFWFFPPNTFRWHRNRALVWTFLLRILFQCHVSLEPVRINPVAARCLHTWYLIYWSQKCNRMCTICHYEIVFWSFGSVSVSQSHRKSNMVTRIESISHAKYRNTFRFEKWNSKTAPPKKKVWNKRMQKKRKMQKKKNENSFRLSNHRTIPGNQFFFCCHAGCFFRILFENGIRNWNSYHNILHRMEAGCHRGHWLRMRNEYLLLLFFSIDWLRVKCIRYSSWSGEGVCCGPFFFFSIALWRQHCKCTMSQRTYVWRWIFSQHLMMISFYPPTTKSANRRIRCIRAEHSANCWMAENSKKFAETPTHFSCFLSCKRARVIYLHLFICLQRKKVMKYIRRMTR